MTRLRPIPLNEDQHNFAFQQCKKASKPSVKRDKAIDIVERVSVFYSTSPLMQRHFC